MKLSRRLLGLGAVALTGCTMLGPDFETPQAPVADTWRPLEDEQVSSTPSELADWWTALDDATLNALIDTALNQNLPLQIAGIRIFEARAQLGIATGNLYPQLQRAGGGISHIELSENQANASPLLDYSYRDVDVGFDAAWELDIWGRFRRGIEAADANLLAEVAGYDDALVSITAEVANAYVAIRTFEARLAIARDNVTVQERSLKIAQVRFDNGATTELDVEQARTLLSNTQASIPSFEIGLRQAQNALSILLGIPPGDLPALETGTAAIPSAYPPISCAAARTSAGRNCRPRRRAR